MVDTVINLGALEHNYKKVKSLLGNSGLMSVIKSDAYGHGIREVLTKIFTFGERFFVISTPEDYKKVFDFPANFLLLYYDPGDIKTILEMHERRTVIKRQNPDSESKVFFPTFQRQTTGNFLSGRLKYLITLQRGLVFQGI